MAIPHDKEIQEALLHHLARSNDHRSHAQECYEALALLFPELTIEEKKDRYRSSISKWANRVQFARLHLVNGGYLFRAGDGPSPTRGVWILTSAGAERAGLTAD
ncbi:winged helix-turn-helix domain-containing protein [Microbacterium sp. UFMG61]|uniref:winged helix-turn-helix domain-containing protein n=1 Tax=Microbacterium sp. UFMG61 TaxID=2745935 RepID=UPI00188FC510